MADIIDEVNDDLRQQQLARFWKENGAWIVTGAVLAVVMTAAMTYWRGHSYRQDVEQTVRYRDVAAAGDVAQLAAFAQTADKDHAAAARFAAASLHVSRGETDKAQAVYAEIAGMRGIDGGLRDLAALQGIGLRLEKDDAETLHKELGALTSEKSVWRFSAMEMEALLYAREGKMQQAVDLLTKISASPDAPQDLRTRAFTLRELYAADIKAASGKK